MKKIKQTVALIITLLLSFSLNLTAAAEDVPEVVVESRGGVVRIYAESGYDAFVSSGFIIYADDENLDYYIVTNLHAVTMEYYGGLHWCDYVSVIYEDSSSADIEIELSDITPILDSDGKKLDLVIIKVHDYRLKGYKALPLRNSDTLRIGESVYALGFPGVADYALADGDNVPSTPDDVTFTAGIISKLDVKFAETGEAEAEITVQHTASINSGNSGGPLLDKNGAVIGVNTWGIDNSDLYYSGIADYIIAHCETNSIPIKLWDGAPTTTTAEETTATTVTTTAPAEITEIETAPPSTEIIQAVEKDKMYTSYGFYITCFFAVILIVFIILLIRKLSKRGGKTPRIIGTAGQYSKQVYGVYGKMTIGRAPNVSLKFQIHTPGVSDVHCELENIDGALTITDRISTYGTFLNGKKITPGQPIILKRGDVFCLGSNSVEFKVM